MDVQVVEQNHQLALANRHLIWTLHLDSGRYTLTAASTDLPAQLEACSVLQYRTPKASPDLVRPGRVTDWQSHLHQDIHGAGVEVVLALTPPTRHLSPYLRVRMYADQPFIALQLVARNDTSQPMALESFSPLHAVPRDRGQVHLGTSGALSFFKNGYQAWSFAGALQANQRDVGTRLGPAARPQLHNLVTPSSHQRGVFWSDMFALLGNLTSGAGWVAGQLTTADQFAVIGADCRPDHIALQVICQADGVTIAPNQELASEWIYLEPVHVHQHDPLAHYTTAVARQMNARLPPTIKTGWCSWYYFFEKVREQDVLANLEALTQIREWLPLEIVQLDDGYEADVGDWLAVNEKFPHGLAWLAEQVKAHGLTPGLWLAPFITKPTARLEHEHPDWLLKDKRGQPVSSGYNWWQWTHALDMTHSGAQDYVRQVIDTVVHEWGYSYLKLDFLYAAALPGRRYDPSTTRAQALRRGLELIRQTAGDETFLLGCGCPLGPGIGLFDANRIGPDVAPHWKPRLFGVECFLASEPGLASARNAIRNIMTRSSMHGRWWHNDPDCLLIRRASRQGAGLTDHEIASLSSVIGLSGGPVLSSDDWPTLPVEQQRYLAALLPPLGQSAMPLDGLEKEIPELYVLPLERAWGRWTVVGLFNWSDRPVRRVLSLARLGWPAGNYHVFDFWNERYDCVREGQLTFEAIPPHAGHVLSIRPALDEPHLVATTFHITMGGEISEFQFQIPECVGQMRITLGRKARGQVWLGLPSAQRAQATSNRQPVPITQPRPGLWVIETGIDRQADIVIHWDQQGLSTIRPSNVAAAPA